MGLLQRRATLTLFRFPGHLGLCHKVGRRGSNPCIPQSSDTGSSNVTRKSTPSLGTLLFFAAAFLLSAYFTFAAVQGDYGLFRRIEIEAEAEGLQKDLERLNQEIAQMENLTRRLSDDYLDLDLLDEQARSVLGLARADEIIVD